MNCVIRNPLQTAGGHLKQKSSLSIPVIYTCRPVRFIASLTGYYEDTLKSFSLREVKQQTDDQ